MTLKISKNIISFFLLLCRSIQANDEGDDPYLSDADFVLFTTTAIGLTLLAGLMSGLTLGLMSLDNVDLEVLKRSGTHHQKVCAAKIHPVIANPHRLLVTLLVCNAIAAEALPLVLDRLTDPITAVIISVTVVLLFGEIIPQAACSAYGLEIGALSAPFVRALMFLTSPLNIPIAWVLDRVLGHRQTALFRRGELKALVDIHGQGQSFGGQLSPDEVRIIKGALDLTNKRAKAAMTPLDMVFMLSLEDVLDEATLTAILASGHSRIPVHRPGNKSDILGILLVKELILVDIHGGIKVSSMKVRSLPSLLAETPMYDMLKLFELGRSHMVLLMQPTREALARLKAESHEVAIDIYSISDGDFGSSDEGENGGFDHASRRAGSVTSSNSDGSEDGGGAGGGSAFDVFSIKFEPHELQPAGIITLEDVLEELLGAEIIDESDRYVDNLGRTRVNAAALAATLPPHLRKAVATWGLTPRIGPASQVYRMASYDREGGGGVGGRTTTSAGGELNSALLGNISELDGTTDRFAAHLPRVLHPITARERTLSATATAGVGVGVGGGLSVAGFRSARRPGRRSMSVAQGVQDQLALLQPLLDARRERNRSMLENEGGGGGGAMTADGDGSEVEEYVGSLRRENSF
jgi:metal transporter CNNM